MKRELLASADRDVETTCQGARTQMHDFTTGSLLHNIWVLSWPNVLSSVFMNLPAVLEGIWLGKLGANALAAVGIGLTTRITLISPLMALSAAGGAVVARYVGAKDQESANRAVLQAVILFMLTAGTIGLVALTVLGPLSRLAGAEGEVLPLTMSYLRIILIGLIAMEMVPSTGFMLVAAGSPDLSLKVNLLVSVMTIASEPVFMLGVGPFRGWGVAGAAAALVLSNALGTSYALFLLLSRRAPVWIDIHRLSIDWGMMRRIVRIALPAVIQRGTPNLANSILLRLISAYGTVPLAAYNIVTRVYNFVTIPAFGISRGVSALVGQNLGARKPERAERGAMYVGAVVLAITSLLVGSSVLLREWVLGLFTSEEDVLAEGVRTMGILGLGFVLFMVSMAFEQSLTGSGDTLSPMVINTVMLWGIQLPLVYLLANILGQGVDGIWWAILIARLSLLAMTFLRFRQGRWKLKEI